MHQCEPLLVGPVLGDPIPISGSEVLELVQFLRKCQEGKVLALTRGKGS